MNLNRISNVVLFRLASDIYNDYDASNDLNGDGAVNNKDVVLLFRKVSES